MSTIAKGQKDTAITEHHYNGAGAQSTIQARFAHLMAMIGHHKTGVISFFIMVLVSLILLAGRQQQTESLVDLKNETLVVARDIARIQSDMDFLTEYQAKTAVIAEILANTPQSLNAALSQISINARAHSLYSVDFETLTNKEFWRDKERIIGQTTIRLSISSRYEDQVMAFLRSLEASWGGKIFVETLKLSRSSNVSLEQNSIADEPISIEAELSLQWRRIWKPLT